MQQPELVQTAIVNSNSISSLIDEVEEVLEIDARVDDGLEGCIAEEEPIHDVSGKTWELSFLDNSESSVSVVKGLYVYRNVFNLIPPAIGGFKRLTTLKFFANEINLFPTEMGNLSELECLQVKVASPGLSGLPLQKLKSLKELELCKVPPRLSAFPILSDIPNLKCLTKLVVCHFSIRYLPPEIGCLGKLEELDLSFNKLKNLPDEISKLEALKSLKVANNKLVELPSGLSCLQRLEHLDLSYNRLISLGCLELASMQTLQKLDLQSNRLRSCCQIPPWVCCNLEGNGKDTSNDEFISSVVVDVSGVADQNLDRSYSSNGSHVISSDSMSVVSSSSSKCIAARKKGSKGWKRRDYLQQRARQERLNTIRKSRSGDRHHITTMTVDPKHKKCKLPPVASDSLCESSSFTLSQSGILEHRGENDREALACRADPRSSTNDGEDENISVDSISICKGCDRECEGAHNDLLANSDDGSSSDASKGTAKSKRHSDRDLNNPKPSKSRRPVGDHSNLSCKYSIESFCSSNDHLPDGFYDAGRDRPFMSLQNYDQSLSLDSREVILVDRERDEELDVIALSAQALLSPLKQQNISVQDGKEMAIDNLQRASLLALFVSNWFGGSDRSNLIARTRKSVAGSNYSKPFVCSCPTGNDDNRTFCNPILSSAENFNFLDLCEKSLRSIKQARNSNVVPIGTLRWGVCRHRAVLMKYLCDRADPPIPCELTRGYLDFMSHAWNIILVKRDNSWVRMVVDACWPTDIREETDQEYFCRLGGVENGVKLLVRLEMVAVDVWSSDMVEMRVVLYVPLSRISAPVAGENTSSPSCSFPSLSFCDEVEKVALSSLNICKFGSIEAVAKVRTLKTTDNCIDKRKLFEYTFLGEVRMLGALKKHSCIVDIYGHQISSKWVPPVHGNKDHHLLQSAIVMEYIKGGSIKRYLEKQSASGEKHIHIDIALFIARDVAFALVELHSKHIIHRDIKSENILIDFERKRADGSPVVKLCDFDRAVPLQSSSHTCCIAHQGIHPPDCCVGTPNWMAPEVLQAMNKRNPYGLETMLVNHQSFDPKLLELLQVIFSNGLRSLSPKGRGDQNNSVEAALRRRLFLIESNLASANIVFNKVNGVPGVRNTANPSVSVTKVADLNDVNGGGVVSSTTNPSSATGASNPNLGKEMTEKTTTSSDLEETRENTANPTGVVEKAVESTNPKAASTNIGNPNDAEKAGESYPKAASTEKVGESKIPNSIRPEAVNVDDDEKKKPGELTTPTYAEKVKGAHKNSVNLELIPNPTIVGDKTVVTFSKAAVQEVEYYKHSLISKLPMLSITLDEIRLQAMGKWKLKGSCKFIAIGRGFFVIRLDNEDDKMRVWLGGTWFIEKQPLRLLQWTRRFDPEQHKNTCTICWVRFTKLPLEFWAVHNLMSMGKALGTPIRVDNFTRNKEFGFFTCVLVEIDFSKPIPNTITLDDEGVELIQEVQIPDHLNFALIVLGALQASSWGDTENDAYPYEGEGSDEESQSSSDGGDIVNDKATTSKEAPEAPTQEVDGLEDEMPNIWVFWKENMGIPETIFSSKQQVTIYLDDALFPLVHASCSISVRRVLWAKLRKLRRWPVYGDFNTILSNDEKLGGRPHSVVSIRDFQDFLNDCLLEESDRLGSQFSCWDTPISKPSNIPFRFCKVWAEHPTLLPLIEAVWRERITGAPLCVLRTKLKMVKAAIKSWKTKVFGSTDINNMREALLGLQEAQQLYPDDNMVASEIKQAEINLNKALHEHEMLLHQKSRLKWIGARDRNTQYSVTKAKREKAMITNILTEDGTKLVYLDDISNHIVSFYEEKFKSDGNMKPNPALMHLIPNMVTEDENISLCAIPSNDEVKHAVFEMSRDSAPGPDGFQGSVLWVLVENIGVSTSYYAKCGSILSSLFTALEQGWLKSFMVSDSKAAIIAFQQNKVPWQLQAKWDYISIKLQVRVKHTWRECNFSADNSANRAAKLHPFTKEWFQGTPAFLKKLVVPYTDAYLSYSSRLFQEDDLEVDIWSYGCLLLELLTLDLPYAGIPESEIEHLLQVGQRPRLTDKLEELRSSDESSLVKAEAEVETLKLLVDLFYQCTECNPRDRPTASYLYDTLKIHAKSFMSSKSDDLCNIGIDL
ncbi:hypothetical protein GIB67_008582 [Kingdonia uniflora]|uniref:Protein kinase domain-containing protein n=1 Tax=Kingdonia uniflora TaxID=39325 RepID=A0A7J7N3N1_9MAGN|nr:hypothetical protein GIB67_008582 [Kingdonia uniflora]